MFLLLLLLGAVVLSIAALELWQERLARRVTKPPINITSVLPRMMRRSMYDHDIFDGRTAVRERDVFVLVQISRLTDTSPEDVRHHIENDSDADLIKFLAPYLAELQAETTEPPSDAQVLELLRMVVSTLPLEGVHDTGN